MGDNLQGCLGVVYQANPLHYRNVSWKDQPQKLWGMQSNKP